MTTGDEDKLDSKEVGLCPFSVMPDGTPAPALMTTDEAIRYLRLDCDGPANPADTLRYYRERGLLKGTRVGRRIRYRRVELERFLARLTEAEKQRFSS